MTDAGNINDIGSSTGSADSDGEDGPEDIAKRRSKNRINARRSRERKRLMMDTLQQEHWKLHQENKRFRMENDKMREAIAVIKAVQARGGSTLSAAPVAEMAFPTLSNQGTSHVQTGFGEGGSTSDVNLQHPNAAGGGPFMNLLLQHFLGQQQGIGGFPGGIHPMLSQLIIAQVLQQQNQISHGGFNPPSNAMGSMGVVFNPLMATRGNLERLVDGQKEQKQQQQQKEVNQPDIPPTNAGNAGRAQQPQQEHSLQTPSLNSHDTNDTTEP